MMCLRVIGGFCVRAPSFVLSVVRVKMHAPYHDGLHRLVKTLGMSTAQASLWRHGKVKPSRAVQFVMKLVEMHGWEALLSGTLAIPPNKVAQDSAQVSKPKRPRKRKVK